MPQQPVFHAHKQWLNFHQTYQQVQDGTWDVYFPALSANTGVADLIETTAQLQQLIGAARHRGLPLRAVGSRWSLSRAPATSGWTINTNRLRGKMRVGPSSIDTAYPGTADQKSGLFLFQCGNTVADVNQALENPNPGRALFTSGAANGQTIVGATATGTHGSALDHGALHDHIVALHLITTADKHYWLERASRPVMKSGWADGLGAELVRDDELFNAAVMSFGSFGIIHAVVLETVPRYLLKAVPARLKLDDDLWSAITDLDFSRHPWFADQGRPYFFQAVINPSDDEVLINANYKLGCPAGYRPSYGLSQDPKAIGPGFDSLSAVGMILERFKGAIPPISKIASAQLFDMNPKTGTPGEIYGYKAPQLHVASGSIAVALRDSRAALLALIDLYREIGPVPLVFGCRYVRKSPALLAFNRFDVGLMVSIDGIDSKLSKAFFRAAAERLEASGIRYTQHWGKANAYTADRIARSYGNDVRRWTDARNRLLPQPADRELFDNEYLKERGLAN